MSYRHKKSAFATDPRELLDNVMKLGLISYDLTNPPKSKRASMSEENEKKEGEPNVLPEDTEEAFAEEESEISLPPPHDVENEICERYVPVQELQFEVEEAKEVSEKKKKRRNYVESRIDYGRL